MQRTIGTVTGTADTKRPTGLLLNVVHRDGDGALSWFERLRTWLPGGGHRWSGTADAPFRLKRWFLVLCLLSVGLISILSALLLERFLASHLLEREAQVSQAFIQSMSKVNDPAPYFLGRADAESKRQLEEFLEHITRMPDVLQANAYAANREVVWSSNAPLIGQRFTDNDELDRALAGQLVYALEADEIHEQDVDPEAVKTERYLLEPRGSMFVESYIPIWNLEETRVVGAIELYREPIALFESLQQGRVLIWSVAAGSALVLFAALYWLMHRADALIRRQQRRLVDIETTAVVGEMSSAVAHSIRNPLAAIRTSAELALEADSAELARESCRDIVAEVDRLSQWVREMLIFSRARPETAEPLDLRDLLRARLDDFARAIERQSVRLDLVPALAVGADQSGVLPARVIADGLLLSQAFNSLIANALEVMPAGGTLEVQLEVDRARRLVHVAVCDSGPGLSPEVAASVFKPFFTSKRNGLGLGLSLAKRIIEGHGGTLLLSNRQQGGACARVQLPLAVEAP
ncbi:MAG: two-component sensor histidine kinase [Gammaproteobacteria bacterium]|nr:two-component sensor histidine kinase [Gammaproteobacteria bacterium]